MHDDYELVYELPGVEDYLRLRAEAGLTPRTEEQARRALAGTWAGCHVRAPDDATVGMGRLIGDGGWYFHVVDMAVLPGHQRHGIGEAILIWLMEEIRAVVPSGAFVSLMADPPGRRLYSRLGFTEDRGASIGMAMWI